jgi:hypothetical protein
MFRCQGRGHIRFLGNGGKTFLVIGINHDTESGDAVRSADDNLQRNHFDTIRGIPRTAGLKEHCFWSYFGGTVNSRIGETA